MGLKRARGAHSCRIPGLPTRVDQLNRQPPGLTHWCVTGPGDTQHSWFPLQMSVPHGVPDGAADALPEIALLTSVPSAAPAMTASRKFLMARPPSRLRRTV